MTKSLCDGCKNLITVEVESYKEYGQHSFETECILTGIVSGSRKTFNCSHYEPKHNSQHCLGKKLIEILDIFPKSKNDINVVEEYKNVVYETIEGIYKEVENVCIRCGVNTMNGEK